MILQTRLARLWAALVAFFRARHHATPRAALPSASPPTADLPLLPGEPPPPVATPIAPTIAPTVAPSSTPILPPAPIQPRAEPLRDQTAALLALPAELLQTSVRRFFGNLGQSAGDAMFDFSRWQTASVDSFYRALTTAKVPARGPAIDRDAALSLPEAFAGFHWD